MFYDTAKNNHGMPVDPFKALVAPRPIGWISTVDAQGRVNLAPFSFYNGVSEAPPMVMYCPGGSYGSAPAKHSLLNVQATGEFVVNVVSEELKDAMHSDQRLSKRALRKAMYRALNDGRVKSSRERDRLVPAEVSDGVAPLSNP